MTNLEAKEYGKQLRKSGASLVTIGEMLAEKGYVSNRTGKPLTQSGVSQLLTTKTKLVIDRKHQEPKAHCRMCSAVKHMLKNNALTAEDNIAMAIAILTKARTK